MRRTRTDTRTHTERTRARSSEMGSHEVYESLGGAGTPRHGQEDGKTGADVRSDLIHSAYSRQRRLRIPKDKTITRQEKAGKNAHTDTHKASNASKNYAAQAGRRLALSLLPRARSTKMTSSLLTQPRTMCSSGGAPFVT